MDIACKKTIKRQGLTKKRRQYLFDIFAPQNLQIIQKRRRRQIFSFARLATVPKPFTENDKAALDKKKFTFCVA
jgi:hypothetical protein